MVSKSSMNMLVVTGNNGEVIPVPSFVKAKLCEVVNGKRIPFS